MSDDNSTSARPFRFWFDLCTRSLGLGGLVFGLSQAFGASPLIGAVLGLPVFVLVMTILLYADYMGSTEYRFGLGSDVGGLSAISGILNAKRSILLTHFSAEPPDPVYTEAVLKKIHENVNVTRIYSKVGSADCYQWLERYELCAQNEDLQYTHVEKADLKTPFNLIIVDGQHVWLFFPADATAPQFKEYLSFNNRQVAARFTDLFTLLRSGSSG